MTYGSNDAVMPFDGGDPNAGLAEFQQSQGAPQFSQYGFDANLNAPGADQGFTPSVPQYGANTQQMYQQMFQQPQQQQFQPPHPGYNQGVPRQNPPAQGQQPFMGQFQQPQFQQPQGQVAQPQYMQPQFQQPQEQTYQPPQFQPPQFQPPQFQPPQFQQAPQQAPQQFQQPQPFGQPNQQGFDPAQYAQMIAQNQQQFEQQYQQPQFQQPQQFQPQFQQPQPDGFPTQNYGLAPQPWQQANPYQQPGQQGQQDDPLAHFNSQISSLEEKYAANQLALNNALLNNDPTASQLARESGQLQAQLTATYVSRSQAESQMVTQQVNGLRQGYEQHLQTLMQQYFGYTPDQNDLAEFRNLTGMIVTPETIKGTSSPIVEQMVIKAFAFDKMVSRGRGQQRAAPRDYVPNLNPTMTGNAQYLGQNNFGQGQQPQGQGFGFQNLSQDQRLGFLSTGFIPQRR